MSGYSRRTKTRRLPSSADGRYKHFQTDTLPAAVLEWSLKEALLFCVEAISASFSSLFELEPQNRYIVKCVIVWYGFAWHGMVWYGLLSRVERFRHA